MMDEEQAKALARREIASGLALGGGIVALALVMSLARTMGWIDQQTVTRIVIGATGLMIAWYGNRMPKAFAPHAAARRVQRVGGWSLMLSGLVYAGLWIFAPIPVATIGGCIAVGAGMAVTLAYCLRMRARTA